MKVRLISSLLPMIAAILTGTACSGNDGNPSPGRDDGVTLDTEDGSVPETPAGLKVFDGSLVHTVDLVLDPVAWQAIIDEAATYVNDNPKRPYHHARLTFDGEELDGDIGMRLKGHISIELTEGHSFPLKLDFNRYVKDLTLDGLKKLNLNTDFNGPPLPTMRDFLSYEAWRQFGVAASRTALARVTVNGEKLGVYVLLEQVDGGFLKRHFAEPRGDLYKPEQQTGGLHWRGPDIADYPDIGHKWPDQTDHAALLNAIEVLDSGAMSEIEKVFDVESVLTYLAGNVALGSGDYYPNTGHNYYLYEETPGRFTLLPWDMNGSQEPMDPPLCGHWEGPLTARIFQSPSNEARYFELVASFLETAASQAALDNRLDVAVGLLGPAISAQKVEDMRFDIALRIERLESEIATTTTCLPLGD